MDRGAWWATVHEVAKLKNKCFSTKKKNSRKIMVFLYNKILFNNEDKLTAFLYTIMVEWPMHNNVYQNKSQIYAVWICLYRISKQKLRNTRENAIHTYKEYYSATKRKNNLLHVTRWTSQIIILKKKPKHKRLDIASYANYILAKAKILGWKSARDCRKEERINLKRTRWNFVWGWKCSICSFFLLGTFCIN